MLTLAAAPGCAARTGSAVVAPSSATAASRDANGAPSPSAATTTPATSTVTLPAGRDIEAHLRFLASDALHGRGSGTRDEWIAATYLGAQLQRLGLEPMGDDGWFVQEVEVQRFTTTAPPTLVIGERTLTHGREMLVRSAAAARATGPLRRFVPEAPVVPGSAVLVPVDATPASFSAFNGAALVLQRETSALRQRWDALASRPVSVAPQVVGVPPASTPPPTVITLDAASHDALLAMAEGTSVTFEAVVTPAPRSRTWNAVGRLSGRDPAGAAEVVVLSAHLDHVGSPEPPANEPGADVIHNGADDDASGVVAVLELVGRLAEGPRPRRTVVVAFFGSEEAGGFGSRYFVNRPVVPLTDIVANLQFETIGRPDPLVPPGTLWLTGFERSTLGPSLAAHGARLVADPRPEQNFFERSDNIQFARRGVVAHTVSSFGLHGEYHQPSDELRHLNLAHMAEAIASLEAPVRWLLDAAERPTWREGLRP